MCEVRNQYLVTTDGGTGCECCEPCSDIKDARTAAADFFEQDGVRHVIYVAVEVTTRDPSPVKFKPVDGVKEAR